MTLKSSEIKKFLSWRISTVLKSFLVSSASCHCTLSHFIRPMLRSHKIRSEDNPLIYRIQSLHLLLEEDDHDEEEYAVVLTMCKRWANNPSGSISVQFLSPMGTLDRIWAPGSIISIHVLSRIGTIFEDEQTRVRLRGFCFSLWSARTSKYIRLQRKIFELHLWGFLLVVVVLFVDQVCDQLEWELSL